MLLFPIFFSFIFSFLFFFLLCHSQWNEMCHQHAHPLYTPEQTIESGQNKRFYSCVCLCLCQETLSPCVVHAVGYMLHAPSEQKTFFFFLSGFTWNPFQQGQTDLVVLLLATISKRAPCKASAYTSTSQPVPVPVLFCPWIIPSLSLVRFTND
jgi:hypothetical protein